MGEFLVWALMLDRGGSAGFVRTYLAIIRAPNFFERRIGRGCRRGRDWAVRPSVLPFSHFVPRTSSFSAILLSLHSAPPIMSFGVPFSLLPPAPVSWRPRPLVLIRPRCNFLSQGEGGEATDSGWKIRPSQAWGALCRRRDSGCDALLIWLTSRASFGREKNEIPAWNFTIFADHISSLEGCEIEQKSDQ